MTRLHLLSWYTQGKDGEPEARRFLERLREGIKSGIEFPIAGACQLGLVESTKDPYWGVAIQVDTGAEADDSAHQSEALSKWFKACGADTKGTDRSDMATTRMTVASTLQSRFGDQYQVRETLDTTQVSEAISANPEGVPSVVTPPVTPEPQTATSLAEPVATDNPQERGRAGKAGLRTLGPVFWVLFIPVVAAGSFLAYLGVDAFFSFLNNRESTPTPTTTMEEVDGPTTSTWAEPPSSTTTLLSLAQVPPEMAWAVERTFEYPMLTHLVDFSGDAANSTPVGWRATDTEPIVTSGHALSVRGSNVVQYTGESMRPGEAVIARFKFVEGAAFTLGLDSCPNRIPKLVGQDGFRSVSVEFRERLFLNVWFGTERISGFQDVGTILKPGSWYTIAIAITPQDHFAITVWEDTSADPVGFYSGDNTQLFDEYCLAAFADEGSLLQLDDIAFIEFSYLK